MMKRGAIFAFDARAGMKRGAVFAFDARNGGGGRE